MNSIKETPIQPWQIKKIHAMLSAQNLHHMKGTLVGSFGEGKESTKDLTFSEANNLLHYLNNETEEGKKANKMRRKIISCLREYGNYDTPDGKADMPRIYQWVLKYGYLKKSLNKYTLKELPKLVTQAEEMLTKKIEACTK